MTSPERTLDRSAERRRKLRRWLARIGWGGALALVAALPVAGLFLRRALPVFRDAADFFLPMAVHTSRALAEGALPLWNPMSFGGEPWLAAIQPAVLYPTTLIYLFVSSFGDAHRLVLLLHRLLLAAGLYRLARRAGLDRPASFLAAALAALGSPLASVAGFENNLRTLAWWPWALEAAVGGGWAASARCGLFLALAFLGGEPELAAVLALLSAAAILWTARRWQLRMPAAVGQLALAAAIAFLLSAPTLVPFLEFWRESDRGGGLTATEAARQALSWRGLVELFSGPAWGVPDVDAVPADRQSYLMVFSVGGALAALAAAGGASLWISRRRSRGWILAAGALLAAAVLPSLPLARLIDLLHLPFRYPVRLAVPVALLGLPILAACAWSEFREGRGARFVPAALLLPLLVLVGGLAGGAMLPPLLRGVAAGVAVLLLLRVRPSRSVAAALALLVVAETASLALLVPVEPAPDRVALVPPPLVERAQMMRPGTRFIADPPAAGTVADARSPVGRFVRGRSLAFGYSNLLGSGASVRGGGPLVLKRYDRYIDAAIRPGRYEALLGAMRVGWFLSLGTPPVAGLQPVSSQVGVSLFGWEGCAPRAWIVESWSRASSLEDAAARIAVPSFDPSKDAVVEEVAGHEVPKPPAPSPEGATARWRIVTALAEGPERLELRTSSSRGGLLVIPDAWYPGWIALVDGREVPIYPVDLLFRGIPIPPGQARVEVRYRPASFRTGVRLGVAGLVLLGAALLVGPRLDRRTPRKGNENA